MLTCVSRLHSALGQQSLRLRYSVSIFETFGLHFITVRIYVRDRGALRRANKLTLRLMMGCSSRSSLCLGLSMTWPGQLFQCDWCVSGAPLWSVFLVATPWLQQGSCGGCPIRSCVLHGGCVGTAVFMHLLLESCHIACTASLCKLCFMAIAHQSKLSVTVSCVQLTQLTATGLCPAVSVCTTALAQCFWLKSVQMEYNNFIHSSATLPWQCGMVCAAESARLWHNIYFFEAKAMLMADGTCGYRAEWCKL